CRVDVGDGADGQGRQVDDDGHATDVEEDEQHRAEHADARSEALLEVLIGRGDVELAEEGDVEDHEQRDDREDGDIARGVGPVGEEGLLGRGHVGDGRQCCRVDGESGRPRRDPTIGLEEGVGASAGSASEPDRDAQGGHEVDDDHGPVEAAESRSVHAPSSHEVCRGPSEGGSRSTHKTYDVLCSESTGMCVRAQPGYGVRVGLGGRAGLARPQRWAELTSTFSSGEVAGRSSAGNESTIWSMSGCRNSLPSWRTMTVTTCSTRSLSVEASPVARIESTLWRVSAVRRVSRGRSSGDSRSSRRRESTTSGWSSSIRATAASRPAASATGPADCWSAESMAVSKRSMIQLSTASLSPSFEPKWWEMSPMATPASAAMERKGVPAKPLAAKRWRPALRMRARPVRSLPS